MMRSRDSQFGIVTYIRYIATFGSVDIFGGWMDELKRNFMYYQRAHEIRFLGWASSGAERKFHLRKSIQYGFTSPPSKTLLNSNQNCLLRDIALGLLPYPTPTLSKPHSQSRTWNFPIYPSDDHQNQPIDR